MVSKKISGSSSGGKKIALLTVSFVVSLYLLLVGAMRLKQWNDFKPYHKLATELNTAMGGGFTITETKYCGIDTPNCPSVGLVKPQLTNSAVDADDRIALLKTYLTNNHFENLSEGVCEYKNEILSSCQIIAINKSDHKSTVRMSISKNSTWIDVSR